MENLAGREPGSGRDIGRRENGKLLELIEHVPIASLKPYGKHARLHAKGMVRQLRDNINEFGFVVPLLVDATGVIIAGHARLQAAAELGFETLPIIRVTHLSDAQVKAFRIADNRLVELGQWDTAALAVEFEAIFEGGIDLDLTGFTVPEIDVVFTSLEEQANDEPEELVEEPAVGEPVSQAGDVWVMGGHRIVCGSALESDSFDRLMQGEQASMIFSDPPYNLRIEGVVGGKGRLKHREFLAASGEMSEREFFDFLQRAIENAICVNRDDAPAFLCMDWRHATTLHLAAERAGLEQVNLCVWVKTNAGMGGIYRSQHELVFVFARKGAKVRNNVELGRHGRNRSNVWQYAGANSIGGETRSALIDHPTPKPVALVADAILDVTKQGDVVLDMFLGGGSTLIACERTRRRCRGIEIDPRYVDVCVRRWQKETGHVARLAATGETFDQVMAQRHRRLLPHSEAGGANG